MTIQEAQKHGENLLRKAGVESLRIDTAILLEKVTGKPRPWLFAHMEERLSEAQAQRFIELVSRRSERTPLVHLTNHREFYGIDLYIDDRVLTPRVETEKMVELAIKYAPNSSRLLDVGTGSGAIAIAIKTHRPDLDVVAIDVSQEALEVARKNISCKKITITAQCSNLLSHIEGRFATIVCNLPYLRDDADLIPEVKKEPGVALFGGTDGLELYRQFLKQLPAHLEKSGYLFTECDPWQQEDLIKKAARVGLTPVEQHYFILGFQRAS